MTLYEQAKEAQKLSLEIWEYLRDHPEVHKKRQLPPYLWSQIELYVDYCPVCEFFFSVDRGRKPACDLCPIGDCFGVDTRYQQWSKAQTDPERIRGAKGMIELLQEWDIEQYKEMDRL